MCVPDVIRKFYRSVTSLRNVLKSAVWGNEDFTVADLMSSEYDLQYASKNFRFALMPKVCVMCHDGDGDNDV